MCCNETPQKKTDMPLMCPLCAVLTVDSVVSQASKLQYVATQAKSQRYFDELLAQKQQLQKLESEYALKIQKLKEAQALRNKNVQLDLPIEKPVQGSASSEPQNQLPTLSSVRVPQPSLHDLKLDKLSLECNNASEADDHEAESVPPTTVTGSRRNSFRQSSSSFTKPHLEQQSPTLSKDSSSVITTKTSGSSSTPAEMLARLDVGALKNRIQQRVPLGVVLQKELDRMRQQVESPKGREVNTHMNTLLQVCAVLRVSHQSQW